MNEKLDSEIQADAPGDKASMALSASPIALSSIHNAVRKLNRDMTLVAAGLLGMAIFAAIVLAFLGHNSKADELPIGARRTALLLRTNPVTPENVMGSNGGKLADLAWEFNSGISRTEVVGTAASGFFPIDSRNNFKK